MASSAASFVLTLSVLVAVPKAEFALFALFYTAFQLVMQFGRSITGMPILVLYSDGRGQHAIDERAGVGAAIVTGAAGFAVLAGMGLLASSASPAPYLLALAAPLLLFQDAGRHVAIARKNPHITAVSDLTWLGLQAIGTISLFAFTDAGTAALIVAWAASGAVAAAVLGTRLRLLPNLPGAAAWLKANAAVCRRLALEFLATSGSYYVLLFTLPVVASLAELGDLRAAQALMGPVVVVLLAGSSFGIPESIRVKDDGAKLVKLAGLIGGVLAGLATAWGLLLYIGLPIAVPAAFPEGWENIRGLVPLLIFYAAALGSSSGTVSALRALDEGAWIIRARALSAVIALIGIPAAAAWGAAGTLLGMGLGETALALRSARRLSAAVHSKGS